jgi:raffinose/stachyose/melibiose transport system permease protein
MRRGLKKQIIEVVAVLTSLVIFGIPFYYIFINSVKTRSEAAILNLKPPSKFNLIENYGEVLKTRDGIVIRAFFNSTVITVASIIVLVLVCAMAGFVLQRRISKVSKFFNAVFLTGLMLPPFVITTIWVLQRIGLFKTLIGLVLVEVSLQIPFTLVLYKNFMATIPKEIDESAFLDGCSSIRMFFQIHLPLLKPVTSTAIVLSAVTIFNDFTNPLYFLPGAKNATVQLTLYNFMSQFVTSWNLLFADVVLISIPPLVLFIFFNKKIIAGMTDGAIKG